MDRKENGSVCIECGGHKVEAVCECVNGVKGSSTTPGTDTAISAERSGSTGASSATFDTQQYEAILRTVLADVESKLSVFDRRLDEVMLALTNSQRMFEQIEDLNGWAWIRRVKLLEEESLRVLAWRKTLSMRVDAIELDQLWGVHEDRGQYEPITIPPDPNPDGC